LNQQFQLHNTASKDTIYLNLVGQKFIRIAIIESSFDMYAYTQRIRTNKSGQPQAALLRTIPYASTWPYTVSPISVQSVVHTSQRHMQLLGLYGVYGIDI